jgi:photosystem II stability/assembly factor-like uncharacterized protein
MRAIGRRLRIGRAASGLGIALVVGAVVAATLAVGLHERGHPTSSATAGPSARATPAGPSETSPTGWTAEPSSVSSAPVVTPSATPVAIPLSASSCRGPLTFVNRLDGWLTVPTGATTSEILSTDNGGASWDVELSAPFWVGELDFVSVDDGWALAGPSMAAVPQSGGLLRTADGGTTWTAAGEPGQALVCVDFTSASSGWALTEAGGLAATSDGGTTWTAAWVGPGLSVVSVCFGNADQGWAVAGTTFGAPLSIYGTADGGASWGLEYSASWLGSFDPESSAIACSGATAWVRVPLGAGAGNLYTEYVRTSDGGAEWTPSPSPAPMGVDFDGMDGPVQIVDARTVVLAGGSDVGPPIFETVVNGVTSFPVQLPVPSGIPYAGDGDAAAVGLSFVGPLQGWVLVSGPLASPTTSAAHVSPAGHAILTGGYGGFIDAVYATATGGASWSLQASYTYTTPAPDSAGVAAPGSSTS